MALVIVAVMTISTMGMTVFAAELTTGTKNAEKTITITSPSGLAENDTTTYNIYKVFNATSNGTSNGINYTKLDAKSLPVTATDGLSKFDADVSGNIHYYTKSAISDENWTLVEDASSLSLSNGMISAIATYVGSDDAIGSVTITGSSTEKTVAVPDYGFYYITTTTGTVVTIDSTAPAANVQDKNSVPSVDKKITNVSNNGTVENGDGTGNENEVGNGKIGDIVTYEVTVHAKKGAVNYIFHDKLSPGLSLEAQSNLTVKVNDSAIAAENYEVKYWNDTDASTQEDTEAGDNITIRFANSYLAGITQDTDIVISYKAKINDNAVIASTGNPNEVVLEYGHDPTKTDENEKKEPTKKTEKDEATVYTYALALKKVNKDGEALANATFQLPFYVKATPAADGAYIYAGTTAPSAGDTSIVNTLTTPVSGEITIKGVQNVQYTFTETIAPAGYNKLTSDFSITPEKTGATVTTTTKETYLDENGNIIEEKEAEDTTTVTYTNNSMAVGGFQTVVNKQGTELPSTGGIGTTIFYVVGALLVLGAGVLLVTRRRARANEQ